MAGLVNPLTTRWCAVEMRGVRGYVRQLHWDLGDLVDQGGRAGPKEEERRMRRVSDMGKVGH